jgi:methylmalonyl-CoA mutase C-terminal domain/subunit
METLASQGVGKLFGPGTPIQETVDYIKEWVSENRWSK